MPLHAIILAAGVSRRMGREKAALPWLDDLPLLPWMVGSLQKGGWTPHVVVGPHNHPSWRERLPGISLCLNPRPEQGKITSVQAGLRDLPPTAEHILITAIDQPRPPALYQQLAQLAVTSPIVVPDRAGHRGHPVVLAAKWRGELARIGEETLGLRGFLDRHGTETRRISCPPEWLLWDFNTPGAYEEALRWFRANQDSP